MTSVARGASDRGLSESDPNSAENVFFTNLLLLSFDPHKEEKKHGIPFHPKMFLTTNAKGMQVILYFLLNRLSSEKAKKAFKNCWPILDQRSQATEFKKQVFALLSQLEKDGRLPSNTVRLSHLQTCCGERFVYMLWHLSSLVLRKVMLQKYPNYHIPPLPALEQSQLHNADVLLRAAKLHVIQQKRKFTTHAQKAVASQRQWKQYAQDVEEDYRRLTVQMNEIKEERKRFDATTSKDIFSKERAILREQKSEQINRIWSRLAQHQEANAAQSELVNDVLTNRINANRIDGAELQAKLAPFLQLVSSPELSKYLTPREVEDLRAVHPVVNDKLDLVAMVKAWNIVLSVLRKRILVATDAKAATTVGPSSKGQENVNPFLEMKNLVPSLPDQLERHSNHLAALRDMNQRLRELIPEIKQNTQKLREKVAPLTAKQQRDNTKTSSSGVLPSPRSTPFASSTFSSSMVTPSRPNSIKDLRLAPPTPPSLQSSHLIDELEEGDAQIMSPPGVDDVETPMREQQIMRSVRRKVKGAPIRGRDPVPLQSGNRQPMLVQTYQESPKQPSSPEKIDTQATPADDKEVGGVVGLNYFSPLKSMDFKELFSPLSIQKSASCFSSWVDFESEANKQREAAELELEWSMIPGQEREGKKEGDEDEMTMMTTQGDITIARAVGAAEGEKEGDRTKGLDALAKELVADFFSDDIFAISGTNYDNEDAFADLLRDGTTKQKKKAGELLFINNREEEDEGDDDEFEDLEGPEKEADEDVQEKERVRELDDDMARMDRQIKEMDNSDFLDFMGDERGDREAEAEAEAEELDSSVQDLRREMKKEAQRRISKCFDFDLEINWDEDEPKKPAKMEQLEEDVFEELDALDKLDSDLDRNSSRFSDAVDSKETEDIDEVPDDERYGEMFGNDQRSLSIEASPFTQLIMEERRRMGSVAAFENQIELVGEVVVTVEDHDRLDEAEEDSPREEEPHDQMAEELVLSLLVAPENTNQISGGRPIEEAEDSIFGASILKDDENDAADWDEFLLASVRNRRTRSVKEGFDEDEAGLLTPSMPQHHHLRFAGSSNPVTPSFMPAGTGPSIPRKLSFSSPMNGLTLSSPEGTFDV